MYVVWIVDFEQKETYVDKQGTGSYGKTVNEYKDIKDRKSYQITVYINPAAFANEATLRLTTEHENSHLRDWLDGSREKWNNLHGKIISSNISELKAYKLMERLAPGLNVKAIDYRNARINYELGLKHNDIYYDF